MVFTGAFFPFSSGLASGCGAAPGADGVASTLGTLTGLNRSGFTSTSGAVVVFARTCSRRASSAFSDSSASTERGLLFQNKTQPLSLSVTFRHSAASS